MKICGIIAEYNPFHKGHEYHLKKAKEISDAIVVITSGYFSQRGLPSLISKQDKAYLALQHGANLVLELPTCYTAQRADLFAQYAIESLSCLGIDYLCFGSETNDLQTLNELSIQMESLPKDVTSSMAQNTSLSLRPNDILGCQYIRHCKKYGIKPVPILRNESFQSATLTRSNFKEGLSQHLDSYFHIEEYWQSYYPYLRTFLCMSDPVLLSTFFLVNEGIEYRLIENAKRYDTWEAFLEASISKTYTRARIQRTCLMILLQITKQDMIENNSFFACKVLGFDSIGQSILKENKNEPIYTKHADMPKFLQTLDIKTLHLYNSVLKKPLKEGPVIYYDR